MSKEKITNNNLLLKCEIFVSVLKKDIYERVGFGGSFCVQTSEYEYLKIDNDFNPQKLEKLKNKLVEVKAIVSKALSGSKSIKVLDIREINPANLGSALMYSAVRIKNNTSYLTESKLCN